MSNRVKLLRQCHAIARALFGEETIDNEPAFVYFMKSIMRQKFGKNSRRELTEEELQELAAYLQTLYNIKIGRSTI